MSRIRLTSTGWAGYTGYLGSVQFIDGVSVAPVSPLLVARIGGAINSVKIDDETGVETAAGLASLRIEVSSIPIPVANISRRATEAEVLAEQLRIQADAKNGRAARTYSHADLETIASDEGIAGLREIAKAWGVKERSIPKLIAAIEKAQNAYLAHRKAAIEARSGEADAQKQAAPDQTPNAIDANGKNIYVEPVVAVAVDEPAHSGASSTAGTVVVDHGDDPAPAADVEAEADGPGAPPSGDERGSEADADSANDAPGTAESAV